MRRARKPRSQAPAWDRAAFAAYRVLYFDKFNYGGPASLLLDY